MTLALNVSLVLVTPLSLYKTSTGWTLPSLERSSCRESAMIPLSACVIVSFFCLSVADIAIPHEAPETSVRNAFRYLDDDTTLDPLSVSADTSTPVPVSESVATMASTSALSQESDSTTPTTPIVRTEVPIVSTTYASTTASPVTTSQASTIRQTTTEPVSQPTRVTSVSPTIAPTFPPALTRDPIGTKFFL